MIQNNDVKFKRVAHKKRVAYATLFLLLFMKQISIICLWME